MGVALAAHGAWAGEGTIPLCQADIPLVITNSGSYVLTENITVSGAGVTGIVIRANHVTIDLNGFTLAGSGTNSGNGILQFSNFGATVRNGFVVNWGGFMKGGVVLGGRNNRVENVTASECSYGIYGGKGGVISICIASSNSMDGIYVEEGSTVERCSATGNVGWGIHAQPGGTVKECVTAENGGGIYVHQGTVAECVSYSNRPGSGIAVDYDGVVDRCSVVGVRTVGIEVRDRCTVRRSYVTSCTNGVVAGDQCVIESVAIRDSLADAIAADDGSIVRGCVATLGEGNGINVDTDCLIVGNVCTETRNSSFDGSGIRARGADNRIEENTCNRNDWGLVVESAGNLIVKNLAGFNSETNYNMASGNTAGPIESGPLVWEKPWANFRFGD